MIAEGNLVFLLQPVVNTCPIGKNPPLVDVFDADLSRISFIAVSRFCMTIGKAEALAQLAEASLDVLEGLA